MLGKDLRFKQNQFKKRSNFDLENTQKIRTAKEYPLEDLYQGTLEQRGRILMGNCPFHQEDTPSFAIYTNTNTYHCFGCQESGDAISFYMKSNNCSFQEALERLS